MLVRPATPQDLPALTEIQNALLDTTTYEWTEVPHTLDERAAWLDAQRAAGHPVFVAVDDGTDTSDTTSNDGSIGGHHRVIGWAAYGDFRDSTRWPGYRFTVEHTVHVAPGRWGRGVGRALLDALVDHARAAGKRVMVAGIDGGNVRSILFHARLGFHEVARMPGIGDKWGERLDLVLMQREIEHPASRQQVGRRDRPEGDYPAPSTSAASTMS